MGQALRYEVNQGHGDYPDIKGDKVTDKPSFLMHGLADLRGLCHRLGIKLKSDKQAGSSNSINKAIYKELNERLRDASTVRRHQKWWPVYKSAYDTAHDSGLYDGLTSKQAHRQARRQAETAVVEAFPDEVTTTRTVRNALDYMHD